MLITVVVYGVVALIVKMDDIGLRWPSGRRRDRSASGGLLVTGMPKLLAWLSVIGTAAMLWVGGHILLVGFDELGWEWPYHLVHDLEHAVDGVPGIGGVLAWLVNTALLGDRRLRGRRRHRHGGGTPAPPARGGGRGPLSHASRDGSYLAKAARAATRCGESKPSVKRS